MRVCSRAAAPASAEQRGSSGAAAAGKLGFAQRTWAGWAFDGRGASKRDTARRRLDAVLETYTDVTRFPRWLFQVVLLSCMLQRCLPSAPCNAPGGFRVASSWSCCVPHMHEH